MFKTDIFLGAKKRGSARCYKILLFYTVLSQIYYFMPIKEENREINLNFTYSYFMESQEKFQHKMLLCPLVSSLPSTVRRLCAFCIDQSSHVSRNTCSTIESNILVAPTRQLLKDSVPSSSCKGLPRCCLELDYVNCQ